MRRRSCAWRNTCALLLVLMALALPATAAHSDELDSATRRVASQLQCPVCEGQNVADSNSGLAQEMRAVIRGKLQAGESEQQILDSFVGSYGDGILLEPPKRGFGLGVWLGPWVALGIGAGLLALLAVRWSRRSPGRADPDSVVVDGTVADELQQFRRRYG